MNFDVICKYLEVFIWGYGVLKFYVVWYKNELLKFWYAWIRIINILVSCIINVVHAVC